MTIGDGRIDWPRTKTDVCFGSAVGAGMTRAKTRRLAKRRYNESRAGCPTTPPTTGRTTVFREPSGRANGLDFDPRGRLVAAEGANTGGRRRVTITEADGHVRVLADRWQGKRFNSPNDLTVDTQGRVSFTDPRYVGTEPRELDAESVYRVDPDGTVSRIITDVQKPNGIVLSPDMKTLYVADTNPRGNQHLLAFALKPDGNVGSKRILFDFGKDDGIDGMCVDVRGNIYGAAGSGAMAGIHVFSSQGKPVGFLPTPEVPTNCVFGGKERGRNAAHCSRLSGAGELVFGHPRSPSTGVRHRPESAGRHSATDGPCRNRGPRRQTKGTRHPGREGWRESVIK
jgi:gluconolactonase